MEKKQQIFLDLYLPCHERLARFVQSMLWQREDARDIISETVVIAYAGFGKLKKREAFLHYLFGIASNLMKQHYRKKKRQTAWDETLALQLADNTRADSAIMLDELNRALQQLSTEYREAITLYEISGLSTAEIAAIQECEESTVRSRIARARQQLTLLLEHNTIPANHDKTR